MADDHNLIDVMRMKKYFPIRGGFFKRSIGAVKAVDDVSFFIKKGETLGLVGESGCGKTTVGRSIMMLTPPTEGYVFFETPQEVVQRFKVVYQILAGTDEGKMTPEAAIRMLEEVDRLVNTPECGISKEKAKHVCADALKLADRIRKAMADKSAADLKAKAEEQATDLGKKADAEKKAAPPRPIFKEDDVRDMVEDALEEVARKHTINFKKKSNLRKMRSRIQFVFQDPFSSLDPKMLVKDIVAEPLQAQLRNYRLVEIKDPAGKPAYKMVDKDYDLVTERDGDGRPSYRVVPKAGTKAKKGPSAVSGGLLEDKMGLTASSGRGLTKKSWTRERVVRLLEHVGLNVEHMYRFPHEFSGGQRQRIGIARALAVNPDFVVLDEPTSALDVSVQAQILNMLNDLQNHFGLTYLFISHDLSTIRYMCDRVAVMYLGKIVEYAVKDELFGRPTHPYTEALLSVIPAPDPDLRKDRIILAGDVPSPANPPPGCRFHTRCPLAKEICSQEEPPLTDRGNEHYVACHVR
jgi:oligopeptide/dipeptide ABC transporter ATP-binding protein